MMRPQVEIDTRHSVLDRRKMPLFLRTGLHILCALSSKHLALTTSRNHYCEPTNVRLMRINSS